MMGVVLARQDQCGRVVLCLRPSLAGDVKTTPNSEGLDQRDTKFQRSEYTAHFTADSDGIRMGYGSGLVDGNIHVCAEQNLK